MGSVAVGDEARQNDPNRSSAQEAGNRSGEQARPGEDGLTQADLTRSIALVRTVGQVESDLAGTLRAVAADDKGPAAERRLTLADDAARGAQRAAKVGERLQERARRWAEHSDSAAPRQVIARAAALLRALADAQNDISSILTGLAQGAGPDLPAQCQQLAAQASTAAQRARDLAQDVQRLAEPEAVKIQTGGSRVANDKADDGSTLESMLDQRLADISRRLAELRQTCAKPAPSDEPAEQQRLQGQWRVQQADRHHEESVTHLLQTRHQAVQAIHRAAAAHDRAAEAFARSAAAGVGDVAERQRMAAFHRAAAKADRQRAQETQDQAAATPNQSQARSPETQGDHEGRRSRAKARQPSASV